MRVGRERLLLIAPAVSAFGLTAAFISALGSGSEPLLLAHVLDDAFYYFGIAENVTRGQFFSFDSITRTNGFHPLWLFVVTPLIALFGKSLLPILVVEALLAQAGGAVLALVVRRLFDTRIALVFAVLLAWNPLFLLFSINGLETGLLIFVLSLVVHRVWCGPLEAPRELALTGALAGLLFLTRTDAIVFLLPAGLELLRRLARQGPGSGTPAWTRLAAAAGSAALVALPWLAFCLCEHGSLVQDSGVALMYQTLQWHEFHGQADRIPPLIARIAIDSFGWLAHYSGLRSGWVLAVLLSVFAVRARLGRRLTPSQRSLILAFAVYFVLIDLASAVRLAPREWYIAPFVPLTMLLAAWLLAGAQRLRRPLDLTVAVVALIATLIGLNARELAQGLYPQHVAMYEDAMWLNRAFGPEDRVGISDAGILGFYADYEAINLDGVVNSEVIPYIRDGRLIDYLRSRQITRFLVRPDWKQPWMMGQGSALLYRSRVLELPSAVAGEPEFSIELGELLQGNAAIHAEHFSALVGLPGRELEKHLGAGWSPLVSEDQTHVWSNAATSELLLPLRDGSLYEIAFRLAGFEPERGHVDVEVLVDDVHSALFHVLQGSDQEYSLRIGPPMQELTRVRFVYSGTHNPKRLGLSQDDRDLAVSLMGIRMTELESATPPDAPAGPR